MAKDTGHKSRGRRGSGQQMHQNTTSAEKGLEDRWVSWELHARDGLTFREIEVKHGIPSSTAHKHVKWCKETMLEWLSESAKEWREELTLRLQEEIQALLGLRDRTVPDTEESAAKRRLEISDRLRAIYAQLAKLWGADSATRIEVTGLPAMLEAMAQDNPDLAKAVAAYAREKEEGGK